MPSLRRISVSYDKAPIISLIRLFTSSLSILERRPMMSSGLFKSSKRLESVCLLEFYALVISSKSSVVNTIFGLFSNCDLNLCSFFSLMYRLMSSNDGKSLFRDGARGQFLVESNSIFDCFDPMEGRALGLLKSPLKRLEVFDSCFLVSIGLWPS